jgi:glycosyltransferase involved in cell wall biosynthesis
VTATWSPPPSPVVSLDELPPQPRAPRVKVLHVITKFWAGAGGNTLVSALGMDPDRYEIWIAGCAGGPLWERARAAGLHTVELKGFREVISPMRDLGVLRQLVRLIRQERFSIVHSHSSKGGVLGRLAGWMTRTPVVVHTFHGFSYHDHMTRLRRGAYLLMERFARTMTDHVFAVAPRVAREAVEMRLARPGRISVVPSAVELQGIPLEPDPTVRAELGIREGELVVGSVGRIDFQKAPLDFVSMASIVAGSVPDVRFVMVGDGTLEASAREEARRLGVPILFTGFRPDAARIASAFDVFVVSSLYEGLGRSMTEALASGRPVVATAVNGVPDLVEPGATGLLAPPSDPKALAASVIWLLNHPHEAQRMGRLGRARVRAIFRPEHMCSLLDQAYSRLLGLPDPTPTADASDASVPVTSTSWPVPLGRTSPSPVASDHAG